MKQPLWILNSALILIFLMSTILGFIFNQKPPTMRKKHLETQEGDNISEYKINKENIYKYDLFYTYIPETFEPTQKDLVSPIPEPNIPTPAKPPATAKPKILPPLNIQLKGTILAASEQKSIAMLADETQKESIYHIGDKIKDAQLIKITRSRIVLIRSNGQHETLYLKKDDQISGLSIKKQLDEIVKKIDANNYQIDPENFISEVESLGMFSEKLSLITAHKKGRAIGVKVGVLEEKSIGPALGLQKDDIIKTINDIPTTSRKNKINIYDNLTSLTENQTIKIVLNREGTTKDITYKLGHIEKPIKKQFTKPDDEKEKEFKMSKLQEREKKIKNFSKRHNVRQQVAVDEIRKRLLENMKRRSRNVRIR